MSFFNSKILKSRKLSFREEVIETLETWFAEQDKNCCMYVAVRWNKCSQLNGIIKQFDFFSS